MREAKAHKKSADAQTTDKARKKRSKGLSDLDKRTRKNSQHLEKVAFLHSDCEEAPSEIPVEPIKSKERDQETVRTTSIESADPDANYERHAHAGSCQGAETIVYHCDGIIDSTQSFKDFGALHLDRRLAKVLTDVLHLEHPTHVQAQASIDPDPSSCDGHYMVEAFAAISNMNPASSQFLIYGAYTSASHTYPFRACVLGFELAGCRLYRWLWVDGILLLKGEPEAAKRWLTCCRYYSGC